MPHAPQGQKRPPMPARLGAALCVVACLQACSGTKVLGNKDACNFLNNPERTKHAGETITFLGEYTSDHMERSVIRPAGCRSGIGVGTVDPVSEKLIDRLDSFQGGKGVRGQFTGTLVQVEPNGMTFFRDDGIRLNVSRLEHAVAFKWDPKIRTN